MRSSLMLGLATTVAVLVCHSVYAQTTYYVATNGSDAATGLDWASALLTISNAVNKSVDTDTIVVSNGTFNISAVISITNGVTVRGVNGAGLTRVRRDGSGGNHSVFFLAHSNAVLDGLTITNGYANGGGVYIATNGQVLNCFIDRNRTPNNSRGAGIYFYKGGIASNCVFTGNYMGDTRGGGAYLYMGGTIKNSVFRNNSSRRGAGCTIEGAGALVENCLFYGNEAVVHAGGIELVNAGNSIVRNCTIVDNSTTAGFAGGVYTSNGGQITNCVIYFNTALSDANYRVFGSGESYSYTCTTPAVPGTNNVTGDPWFANRTTGNYRLLPGSSCTNAGINQTWMTGALDLDGNARISGGTVDIGAYEYISDTLLCNFSADSTEGSLSNVVVLTAFVDGTNTTGLYYRWDFDNDGTNDVEGLGAQVVTNTFYPGSYTVSLLVSNAVGETDSETKSAYILVGPATNYVSLAGSHIAPFTSWAQAATNIQAAVSAGTDGTLVLVTNGIYLLTNQISVTKGIIVRSLNGATDTIARRTGAKNHRIFYVSHSNAVVDGFTMTNGYTGVYSEYGGGAYIGFYGTVQNCIITKNVAPNNSAAAGVYLYQGGLVSNCIIRANTMGDSNGGGFYMNNGGKIQYCSIYDNTSNRGAGGTVVGSGGIIENCLIYNNTATFYGGGIYFSSASGSSVRNCTITENNAGTTSGGGVYMVNGGNVSNCIIYANTAPAGANYTNINSGWSYSYTCTTPAVAGSNNITGDPLFVNASSNNYRLGPGSPCINTGSNQAWMATANDLDGTNRILESIVDIGAYEYDSSGPLTAGFSVDSTEGFLTNIAVFTASVTGSNTNGLYYRWDFDNDGTNDVEGSTARVVTNLYYPGLYSVALLVSNVIAETDSYTKQNYILVGPATNYVSLAGSHVAPFTNWVQSATNIQSAVDAGTDGTLVLVTNGTYLLTNQISVTKGITVRSIHGKMNTIARRTGAQNHRIFYLSHSNAVVDGFTITNGLPGVWSDYGGGVRISLNGTVQNCDINGNQMINNGAAAGAYLYKGGVIQNCTISGNSMWDYTGGGIYLYQGGLVKNCIIKGNSAHYVGGVRLYQGGIIENSLIDGNSCGAAGGYAGGVDLVQGGIMKNCTVVNNSSGADAGGVRAYQGGAITNSIIYFNTAVGSGDNYLNVNSGWSYSYSCTTPSVTGTNNTTNAPMFVDTNSADYALLPESPCVDAGINQNWMIGAVDLSGNPRIGAKQVDMGAYEVVPPGGTVFIIR